MALARLLSSFQNFMTLDTSFCAPHLCRVCLLPPSSPFAWESEAAALPAAGVYLLTVGKSCMRELLLSPRISQRERKRTSWCEIQHISHIGVKTPRRSLPWLLPHGPPQIGSFHCFFLCLDLSAPTSKTLQMSPASPHEDNGNQMRYSSLHSFETMQLDTPSS